MPEICQDPKDKKIAALTKLVTNLTQMINLNSAYMAQSTSSNEEKLANQPRFERMSNKAHQARLIRT